VKKLIFLLAFLLLASPVGAATYYVDCNANGDAGAGTGTGAAVAWKTIAKVNGSSFSAGDSILFNKGCTWREKLTVPSSGSAGSPITFGAYGTGANPIFQYSVAKNSTGDWTADSSTTTGSWTGLAQTGAAWADDTDNTYNFRVIISAATSSTSGSEVRACFRGHSDAAQTIQAVSIGPRATTTANFSSAPTALKVSGNTISSASPLTIAQGLTTLTCTDWATFTFDETKDYLVHFWAEGLLSNDVISNPASGTNEYTSATSTDMSLSESVTMTGRKYIMALDSIDVRAVTANVWYATGVTEDVGHIATISTSAPTILAAKKSTKAGCTSQGDFFYDADTDRLYIYSTSNPATAYSGFMELATGTTDSYVIGGSAKNYITIDGISIKYSGGHGMKFNGSDNLTVKNCNVSYVGGAYITGTTRYGNGIEGWSDVTNATIQDNTVSQTYDEGITVQGDGSDTRTNVTIQRNTIDRCGRGIAISTLGGTPTVSSVYVDNNTITNSGLGWATPAISNGQGIAILLNTPQCTSGYVRGNTITTTASGTSPIGQGISLGAGTWEISRNKISDTHNSAIRAAGDPTLTIAYNIITDSNTNKAIYSTGDDTNANPTVIYNNTMFSSDAYSGMLIALGTNGGYGVTNHTLKNNIFYTTDTNSDAILYVSDSSTATLDNNLYYRPNAGDLIRWSNTTTYTQAQWANYKTASSQDAHSPTPADPLFVSTTNFHLQPTSPARRAGVNVGLTTDFAGRLVKDPPDIGAYQYFGGRHPMRIGGKWR
jgi:hypothetical protein